MSETFKVGEIAIYVRPGSPFYGREVEVLSGLLEAEDVVNDLLIGEKVKCSGKVYRITDLYPMTKGIMTSLPEWLRKKKPPQREIDQLVSWDDCVWRPERVHA